jgi:hypothetical protein
VEPAPEEEGLVAGDAERHRLPTLRAGHWCRSCVLPKAKQRRRAKLAFHARIRCELNIYQNALPDRSSKQRVAE